MFLVFEAMMLTMAVTELVVSIWVAVLCCKAVCRCCKQNSVSPVVGVGLLELNVLVIVYTGAAVV